MGTALANEGHSNGAVNTSGSAHGTADSGRTETDWSGNGISGGTSNPKTGCETKIVFEAFTTNHSPCPDNARDRGSGSAAASITGADDTGDEHSHTAVCAAEKGAPHGTGYDARAALKIGDTVTGGAPATARCHETANGDIGVAQYVTQDIKSAQTNEGGDETGTDGGCGHLEGNENDHKTEHKAADTDSAESTCKDNDPSHENVAETRMHAEIGTDDQSDASRSQAPQGAGDETDMAWRSETATISAVIQVADDDGGVHSISVGIGSGKMRGASSKAGAK